MYTIIGASGYLGTYLIKNVLERTGENVLAVSRHPLTSAGGQPRVKWVTCDIADPDSVKAFCEAYLNNAKNDGGGYLIR